MKCKKCGYRASDIAHLAAHYRKKHPEAMKARRPKTRKATGSYCPTCGRKM